MGSPNDGNWLFRQLRLVLLSIVNGPLHRKIAAFAFTTIAIWILRSAARELFQREARDPLGGRKRHCRSKLGSCVASAKHEALPQGAKICWDSLDPVSCGAEDGIWLGPSIPADWQLEGRCYRKGTDSSRMACLPSIINLAPPKSGTTDLYRRLTGDSRMVPGDSSGSPLCAGRPAFWCQKEPNFWQMLSHSNSSLAEYTSFYKQLSDKTAERLGKESDLGLLASLDWSPLTFDVNPRWIQSAFSEARFVALLRDPVKRALSDYNYVFFVIAPSCGRQGRHRPGQGSPRHFHDVVQRGINIWKACLSAPGSSVVECWRKTAEVRSLNCETFRAAGSAAFVLRGLYSVYLGWFLESFPRSQFFVRRSEDMDFRRKSNEKEAEQILSDVFKFAGLDARTLPEASKKSELLWAPGALEPKGIKDSYVEMLPETRHLLQQFYNPYVQNLRELFDDSSLTWW
eukprot:TRINITY_DN5421_c0_g5_i1.p1 TRINITY_DN5421_c0_g5~~TRINITY_DN5421_c0_g5_i1.p1  ORF type:complete len:457 (-),score=61.78 TRINITY_DN5421_c0_g5_i1:80-1450(-)